jgi:hypothetical protein
LICDGRSRSAIMPSAIVLTGYSEAITATMLSGHDQDQAHLAGGDPAEKVRCASGHARAEREQDRTHRV